jgi:hypothetical protein
MVAIWSSETPVDFHMTADETAYILQRVLTRRFIMAFLVSLRLCSRSMRWTPYNYAHFIELFNLMRTICVLGYPPAVIGGCEDAQYIGSRIAQVTEERLGVPTAHVRLVI